MVHIAYEMLNTDVQSPTKGVPNNICRKFDRDTVCMIYCGRTADAKRAGILTFVGHHDGYRCTVHKISSGRQQTLYWVRYN